MNSPGHVSLSAIAILTSPRPIDPQKGTRNIAFDANFYIIEGSQTSSLALLRYFTPEDMISSIQAFSEKPFQKAFIIANVHTISPNLITEDLEMTDYSFVGDIVQLTIIDGDVNERTRPYITISGVITHLNVEDYSFEMSPTQYIALAHTATPFPIHAYFVESKRWGDGKKPKVSVGSTIALGGFLEKIRRERDIERTVSIVEVEIINIAFLSTRSNTQLSPHRLFSPHSPLSYSYQ
ncbi:hypothetical protein BYT27DRAFT_7104584 [Phlegmacium glaucopus]|nr:hypothetical protein BYT27DRAFT_7104584 [Phlegmacium glaucopus]